LCAALQRAVDDFDFALAQMQLDELLLQIGQPLQA